MIRATDRPDRRTTVSVVLDVLIVLSGALAVSILVSGGFEIRVMGHSISAHRSVRGMALVGLLLAIRLLFFDQHGRRASARARARQFVPASWQGLRNLWAARRRMPVEQPSQPVSLFGSHAGWALLGLIGFTLLFLHPQFVALYSVPDLGDPLFSMWRVGWVHHWLEGDPRPLFSPNIFYPEPLALTFSDSMLLPALMGWPLLEAGTHPVVAYNLLFIASFVLSGFAMYLLVADLTSDPRAAFVAALLFGFYPFRFEHYSHLELQMTHWMPLALLGLHRFLRTQKIGYAVAAALCVVAQLYSSMYFGLFFVLYAIPVAGTLGIFGRVSVRRLLPAAIVASMLAGILAIPLAKPYLAAQSTKGERDIPNVTYYSAVPLDYLSAHDRRATYFGWLRHPEPERALFPGVVAPALAGVALLPPFGVMRLAYAAGLVFAFDASLGFHGFSYPYLYEWLDPIRGIRVPARFGLIVGMTLSILAGFGTWRLLARCRTSVAATLLIIGLTGAIVIDFWPRIELRPVWREPPPIYSPLLNRPDVVLAEFPWRSSDFTPHLPSMFFSLWHWANMVNGYSGFEPPGYQQFLQAITPFPADSAIEALQARGVTHVSINCALYGEDADCHSVLEELDGSPRFRRLIQARWEDDTSALYELVR
jgi:hypothetical protein